ncbi:MAG: (2Fe-2S)-binding protein [Pseudomonadota bacterium]
MICACNGVGAKTILAAASACRGDLDRIADATGAGAVCGSCRPEIRTLLTKAAATV